jgi:tRNA (guanine-N7-)-methyltransferase
LAVPEPPALSRAAAAYLVPWTRLDWPLEWDTLFGRSAPLRLELGFGDGAFLEASARRDPGADWVGVELSWASVKRMLRRMAAGDLQNIRILEGNAAVVLAHAFAPGSVDAIVINHSDPWPKKRHHERRLVQPALAASIAERLRPGGGLTVVTDHEEYAAWIESVLQGEPRLRSRHPTPRVHEVSGRVPTRYERKALERGETVHYFEWKRIEGPVPPGRAERMEPMPNALLAGDADLDTLLARFEPAAWEEEHEGAPVRIRLENAYRREDGREWLVECRLDEGGFQQHFFLSASPREGARILIKPAPMGFPRPTRGVRRAVFHLARKLLAAEPRLEELSSTVGALKS